MAKITTETQFRGLPISGGMAVAEICLYNEHRHGDLPVYHVTQKQVRREQVRVQQSIHLAMGQLDVIVEDVGKRIGPAEARIFLARKAILGDAVLGQQICEEIETLHLNAESAVARTLDGYESRLLEAENEYIRERASDINEIRRRLLDVLGNLNPSLRCGDREDCHQGCERIIVAENLSADLIVHLDTRGIIGLITERGGSTSHAAILVRALGIPAVSGIQDIHSTLGCGTRVIISGDTGEVIVWPCEETIARVEVEQAVATSGPVSVDPSAGLTVMANIACAADVHEAINQQAEGIGLYRTELEFLAAGRLLDEEEQYERYASVARAFPDSPVCFRLLDIGADKAAPFFNLPAEENPHLGFRGSRLLLRRLDLLRPQARALTRASHEGPVWVVYPMIVDLDQFLRLKEQFCEAAADLPAGDLRHGVMFEVPSACLQAHEILQEADFGTVGTNDLVQYLFAVDRNNEFVADDFIVDRPVFWALMEQLALAAADTEKMLSVCGEAAGDPLLLPKFLELGINTMSVSPRYIPKLREAVQQTQATWQWTQS